MNKNKKCWVLFLSWWVGLVLSASADLAPVLNPIGNKQVRAGETLSFTLSAASPSGKPLFFSAKDLPANAALNSNTGYFNWIPDASQVGTYHFTFIVSDNGSPVLTSSETIVTLSSANDQAARINGFPLAFPSPYNIISGGNITLQYSLSQSADIDVIIVGANGQIIKKLSVFAGEEGGKMGINKLLWDVKTDFGTPASSGIYIGAVIDKKNQGILGKIKIVIY